MNIKEISVLLETILKACLVMYSEMEHDFGSEIKTKDGSTFRLTFERIDK